MPPRVSLIQRDACCTPCRPVAQPVQRLLEASRFSQFCRRFALPSFRMPQACTSTLMCWQFRCANLGDRKRLEKDTLHLQRSSNKLSPTPRLHTRIWEWMISAVGKKWAVRFHSPRTRHGRSGEPWSENVVQPTGLAKHHGLAAPFSSGHLDTLSA